MDSKKITDDLILCRSTKSFPGKWYYYSLASGRSIWKAEDEDAKKNKDIPVASAIHKYPEPDSVWNEKIRPNTSAANRMRQSNPPIQRNLQRQQPKLNTNPVFGQAPMFPTFGQALFPKFPNYLQDLSSNILPITWVPCMPMCMMPNDFGCRPQVINSETMTERFESNSEELLHNGGFIPSTPSDDPITSPPSRKRNRCKSDSQAEVLTQEVFGKKSKNCSEFENGFSKLKACENWSDSEANAPMSSFNKVSSSKFTVPNGVKNNRGFRKIPSSPISEGSVCSKISTLTIGNKVQSAKNRTSCSSTTKAKCDLFSKSPLFPSSLGSNANKKNENLFVFHAKPNKNNIDQNSNLVFKNTAQISMKHCKKDGVLRNPLLKLNDLNHTVISNRSIVEEKGSLSQRDKICNESNNSLEKLDRSDMRFLIVAKRRKSLSESHCKDDERLDPPIPAKKRVTFDLDEDTENIRKDDLRQIIKTQNPRIQVDCENTNHDIWYFILDIPVLLKEFEFIHTNFLKQDDKCHVYIPSAVYQEIKKMSIDIKLSRELTMAARQVNRWIVPQNVQIEVQSNSDDTSNMTIQECIIDCCLELMSRGYTVVLLTNNQDFTSKAISYGLTTNSVDEIKQKLQSKEELTFDIQKVNGSGFTGRNPIHKDNTGRVQNREREESLKLKSVYSSLNTTGHSQVEGRKEEGELNFFRNEKVLAKQPVVDVLKKTIPAKADICTANDNFDSTFEVNSLIGDRIKTRIDEYICWFGQIIEGSLTDLLLTCPNVRIKAPWDLSECLLCISDLFGQDDAVKLYCDSFTHMLNYHSDAKGKLKTNMAPEQFTQLFSCAVSLMKSLNKVVSKKHTTIDAEKLLDKLKYSIIDPSTDALCALDKEPPSVRGDSLGMESDNSRLNYMKSRSEVITYLKKHFKEWASYEENSQNDMLQNSDAKVLRTFGKNLNLLKFDNAKNMVIDTARTDGNVNVISDELVKSGVDVDGETNDKRVMVKLFKPIKAFEEKLKLQFACTETPLNDGNLEKPVETVDSSTLDGGKVDGKPLALVCKPSTVDDNMTNDSGFETDYSSSVKTVFSELGRTFKVIYRFIKKNIRDYHKYEANEGEKKRKEKQMQAAIDNITKLIDELESIRSRETEGHTSLKAFLIRTGENPCDDRRITRYRQIIVKCREQAIILQGCLKFLLQLVQGKDTNAGQVDTVPYYNIFENVSI